jgi:peptidyl-prolyl isomerase E (cyclophilin E)
LINTLPRTDTIMAVASPNMLFVSGLVDNVTEEILLAAFIPFGEIKSIQIARDYVKDKAKGFGFVEFSLEEDAAAAIENMDGSELFGKTVHCKLAKHNKLGGGKAIWSSDDWKRELGDDGANMEEDSDGGGK